VNNSDILRRIRYTFDFDDTQMMALVELGGGRATREQISAWLKRDDDPALVECTDTQLAIILNGLIVRRRGKKEGPQPEPEKRLTNNIVLRKLKIALNLRDDGVLEILALAGLRLSRHELSAFFRKPGHKHFRECQDQFLRNFLKGLQNKLRADG
jgi:uncharacterized protein YehS (DUF1456 family)